MIAVDTNVLVRVLVADNTAPEQNKLAQQLLTSAGKVFVPQVVQIELVWVLESAFDFDKQSVLSALNTLLEHPFCELQHELGFQEALVRFKNGSAGFADSLIAAESDLAGRELWTFDRKLAQQAGVTRLTAETVSA